MWCRVTRHPRVFPRLTDCQRTPGFWDVTKLQSHIAGKIKDFPNELRTKEMIHNFLGCVNYSFDFIKDLDKERQELQKLLTKKNQIGWSEKHTMIVKRVKNICSDLPKLRLPNENDNLIL